MNVLGGSHSAQVGQLTANYVEGVMHYHPPPVRIEDQSLHELLQPIEDASHTRDRKRSPPDSACMPGTRLEVVQKVGAWTQSGILDAEEPHICLMHGYVGCGKSAISQEICRKSQMQGRPVASFFFFRNAGDRSKIWRLAPTLANQMAAGIPETAPFVRAAIIANPALKNIPVPKTSVAMQMQCLVWGPFKSATERTPMQLLGGCPFLIMIDGLDECEDKEEVRDLIEGMLEFFNENPLIPLRVFITSRVEQHIQSHLEVPGVRLENLVDHCTDDDVATFLDVLFEHERRRNRVIQAYIREHGEWPTQAEKGKLVGHIGKSFIFAWSVFRFIVGSTAQAGYPSTPMDRLPLALKMNPGLDGLYAETLARSEYLPHFLNIISTIALVSKPLPTSGIAELLGISIYEVINVLVDLQAIIQVPGTDNIPVTLFHTSLRDFLTTQNRSGRFFAHPRHHVRLYFRCLECETELYRQRPGTPIDPDECKPAVNYSLRYSGFHLRSVHVLFEPSELDLAIRLRREVLELHPGAPELKKLADAIENRARGTGSLADSDEAISLYRQALELRPSPHPDHLLSLDDLGYALLNRFKHAGTMATLEEAISLHRETLALRPLPDSGRAISLSNLANALSARFRQTGTMADLEEVISLHREALVLRPPPDPGRAISLSNLANALSARFRQTGTQTELEEAISLHREALALRPPPSTDRANLLTNLGGNLLDRFMHMGIIADLEEAISLRREALALWPSPHPDRAALLSNLANALSTRFRRTGTMADLEEAISLYRQGLALQQPPHPYWPLTLIGLTSSLRDIYKETGALPHLQEAILQCEELLASHQHYPSTPRIRCINLLAILLQMRFDATQQEEDLLYIARLLKQELNQLTTSNLGIAPQSLQLGGSEFGLLIVWQRLY